MDDSPIQTALCVIGHPIGGNPTQFVALRALAALGLDWQFVSFDVEPSRIEEAIRGIDSLGFCGAMIANPYQSKVADILMVSHSGTNDTHPEPPVGTVAEAPEISTWFDCLIRDDGNRLVAHNLYAETVKTLIDSHASRIGQSPTHCLLLNEPPKLKDFIEPLKETLPELVFSIAGTSLRPWPDDRNANTPPPPQEEGESSQEPIMADTPSSLSDSPWLIIWGLDAKPKKKASSKSPTMVPSPASVTDLLSQLHPDSLIIDLSGTTSDWLDISYTDMDQRPQISIVNALDLALLRLATALKRWTGREPNMELMREAIEEYLEV